jgi:hypothetical protein
MTNARIAAASTIGNTTKVRETLKTTIRLDRSFSVAVALFLVSWLTIRAGILVGELAAPAGEKYTTHSEVQIDLFKFDSDHYRDIAIHGYSYNGDPYSSPNLVFAPLFPLIIRTLAWLPGLNDISAGFAVNKLMFLLALFFLHKYLLTRFSAATSTVILLAVGTSAGAYAFHAYYSESLMLLLLALCLFFHDRRNWLGLALACAALGASRVAALPMVIITAMFFGKLAWDERTNVRASAKSLGLALLCATGAVSYLAYIAIEFGNPFKLFPQIQSASWGLFHPPTPWFYVLTGRNLIDFATAALNKGALTYVDIQTINLAWTLLAGASAFYVIAKLKGDYFSMLFAGYFGFVYVTGAASPFLISAHRFYVLMLPVFVMFADLHGWMTARMRKVSAFALTRALLLVNVEYCIIHTARFNQGVWYFF